MTIVSQDGRGYPGQTITECITAMFEDSRAWTGDADLESYMKRFADRARVHGDQIKIRTASPEVFAADAAQFGLLTINE